MATSEEILIHKRELENVVTTKKVNETQEVRKKGKDRNNSSKTNRKQLTKWQ